MQHLDHDDAASLPQHHDTSVSTPSAETVLRGSPLPHHPAGDIGCTQKSKAHEFSRWLADVIPVGLIPNGLGPILQQKANLRLDIARKCGMTIKDIYFGEDCLPTWSNMCWDPEEQSLHDVIQERLSDIQLAFDLGTLLQQDIRVKCNKRIKEAQRHDIELHNIVIGPSLLPEWNTAPSSTQSSDSATCTTSTGSVHETREDENAATPPSATEEDCPNTLTVDEFDDDCEILDSGRMSDPEDFRVLQPTDSQNYFPMIGLNSHTLDDADDRTFESMDEDEKDDNESNEAESDDDVEICLNNSVSSQPIYDDYGRSNIVHDVEIFGGDRQFSYVDLEVYLAVDDEDYEDLPEVELAINREAYEQLCGDQGAIDVHIPGAEIFCFDGIEESDDEDEEQAAGSLPGDVSQSEEEEDSSIDEGMASDGDEDVDATGHISSDSETCSEEE